MGSPQSYSVFGAGAWGFALANVFAGSGHPTVLWGRNSTVVQTLRENREFSDRLPGCRLDDRVRVTDRLDMAWEHSRYVCAVPTQGLREFFAATPQPPGNAVWINGTKGIDPETLLTSGRLLEEWVNRGSRVYTLSGPSHAEELARGMPTSVVLAGDHAEERRALAEEMSGEYFRIYDSADRLGVELAGALKNVVALAAGICDGLGFGDNTQGALITRGLAEITRLGQKLGGRWETFAGLAGMGDLITTCTSKHSRNRQVGTRLGSGEALRDILASMAQTAEGVNTTPAALRLGQREALELPITEQVYAVLYDERSPREAAAALMTRTLKEEATTYAVHR